MGLRVAARAAGVAAGLMVMAALCRCSWAAAPSSQPAEPQPAMRIPVAPLGYLPPSSFYLTYRLSSASLGFFDDSHLLFTFRVNGLLRRIPGDPASDDDQEIRAVVLDTATGKVLKQSEWRMHDRSQYLWPFPDGKFLVRVRDDLFLTGTSLELQLYLRLSDPLRSIQISPDRRWMVLESDDPERNQNKPVDSESLGTGKPVKVMVLASGSNVATLASDARNPVTIPIMGDWVLDTLEGHPLSAWIVRATPMHGEPRTLTELKSGCQPTLHPVSSTVTLAMGCYGNSDKRPVVAISSEGEQLWRQTWQNKYVWPWFTSAENGSRFAYESLQVGRDMSNFDALYPEDVVAQWVGVYDTLTGKMVLVKDVSPILSAGQNVALSPDGSRFAVLRQGAIEIYDLPPVEPPAPESPKQAPETHRKKK